MKKYLAAAAVALSTLSTVAVASPASANAPCITRPEFNSIRMGMTLAQVSRIVGGPGQVSVSSPPFVIRSHRTCAAYHVSNVTYTSGRVSGKLFV